MAELIAESSQSKEPNNIAELVWQSSPEEPKPEEEQSWLGTAWEKVKDFGEWLYPKGWESVVDIPRQYGAAIGKGGMAAGEAMTWLVRLLPGNEDLPSYAEQPLWQQAKTVAQAGATIAVATVAVDQGITTVKGLKNFLRLKRGAEFAERGRAGALEEAGLKVKETITKPLVGEEAVKAKRVFEFVPKTTAKGAADIPTIFNQLRQNFAQVKMIEKPVFVDDFALAIRRALEVKTVGTQATQSLIKDAVQTFVTDITSIIPAQFSGKFAASMIDEAIGKLDYIANILSIGSQYTGEKPTVTPEQELAETELAKPLEEVSPYGEKFTTSEMLEETVDVLPIFTPLLDKAKEMGLTAIPGIDTPEYESYRKGLSDSELKLELQRIDLLEGTQEVFSEIAPKAEGVMSAEAFLEGIKPVGRRAQFRPSLQNVAILAKNSDNFEKFKEDLQEYIMREEEFQMGTLGTVQDDVTLGFPEVEEGPTTIHYEQLVNEINKQFGSLQNFYNSAKLALPEIPPRLPPSDIPKTPGELAVDKLNKVIIETKLQRVELTDEQIKERGKRFQEMRTWIDKNIDQYPGEEAWKIILSKFKGKLAEGKLTLGDIRDKLTQEDVDALKKVIIKSPKLSEGEILSTGDGLDKLLAGDIPQPKQLVLLSSVIGPDIVRNIVAKRLTGGTITDLLTEIANVPRALLATADLSGTIRPGGILFASHPVLGAKAYIKQWQAAINPEVGKEYFDKVLPEHQYWKYIKSYIDLPDPRGPVAKRTEQFYGGRLLEAIPGVGKIFEFADWGYSIFGTKMRVDVFNQMLEDFERQDFDLESAYGQKLVKSAADVVNTFTGRAPLPGALEKIAPQLNILLWSPKRNWSMLKVLWPGWYWAQPAPVRKKAMGDLGKAVGVGITILGLIYTYKKLHDIPDDELNVELDPRSTDFGKIKIGNTRFDIWGGYQQWVRTIVQVASGVNKSGTTGEMISEEKFPFTTRWDRILRFVEGKLAPTPALVKELLQGAETYYGEDMTLGTTAYEKFTPMYLQDIIQSFIDGGMPIGILAGVTAFHGVGVVTYGEEKKWQPGDKMPWEEAPGCTYHLP